MRFVVTLSATLAVALAACGCVKDDTPKPPPGYPRTADAVVLAYFDAKLEQRWDDVAKYLRHVDAEAQARQLAQRPPKMPDIAAHVRREVVAVDEQPAVTLVTLKETRPDPAALMRAQLELAAERGVDALGGPGDEVARQLFAEAAARFAADIEAGKVKPRTLRRTYRVIEEDGALKVVAFLAEMERAMALEADIARARAAGDEARARDLQKERDAVVAQIPASRDEEALAEEAIRGLRER